jgi:cytochrome b561
MPAWQRVISSLVHWGLYFAVFVQLTAGAMVVATGGKGLPVFGFFSIPLPVEQNRENHEWWEEIHEFMWKPLAALLVLHVLGALYNHFVVKNDVLRRMTVGVK